MGGAISPPNEAGKAIGWKAGRANYTQPEVECGLAENGNEAANTEAGNTVNAHKSDANRP